MSTVWKTKWGARRIRHDPPTLAEAIAAAEGFTEAHDEQAAIAAELMGVPIEDALREIRRLASDRRGRATIVAATGRDGGTTRAVVVERKISRRLVSTPGDRHRVTVTPR